MPLRAVQEKALPAELPELSTVGILGGCSLDRPVVDLSTNSVAE